VEEDAPVMREIVLMSDPRVTNVPVHECGEPLFDIRDVTRLQVDTRRADPSSAFAHLRTGLLDRLLTAETRRCSAATSTPTSRN
jgi:D-alanyl-D-alanine dipeptidase